MFAGSGLISCLLRVSLCSQEGRMSEEVCMLCGQGDVDEDEQPLYKNLVSLE